MIGCRSSAQKHRLSQRRIDLCVLTSKCTKDPSLLCKAKMQREDAPRLSMLHERCLGRRRAPGCSIKRYRTVLAAASFSLQYPHTTRQFMLTTLSDSTDASYLIFIFNHHQSDASVPVIESPPATTMNERCDVRWRSRSGARSRSIDGCVRLDPPRSLKE